MDGSKLVRQVLGVAMTLARHCKKSYPEEKRIGWSAPGKGGRRESAVILAGKIPVNLNFTSLREAIDSAPSKPAAHDHHRAWRWHTVEGFP